MFSFGLKAGINDAPSHLRLLTFDTFSGMHQCFAGTGVPAEKTHLIESKKAIYRVSYVKDLTEL
jgi:hypothetical protein